MTSDRIEGKAKEVIGAGKEKLGDLTGDEELETEGREQNAEGKVQQVVGQVKSKVEEIKDKLS